MIIAEIEAGICGLHTTVEADSPHGTNVALHIESDCPQVHALSADLGTLDAFRELFQAQNQTRILELAAQHRLHTTCIVPIGILKAIEAAARLALPATSRISLKKEG